MTIQVMDYVTVVNDKKMKGSGLSRGDILMVTSTKQVPASPKDEYLSRTFLIVIRVVDGVHLVPKDGTDDMVYLIDPRNVEKLNEEDSKELYAKLHKQYGAPVDHDTTY